MKKTQEKPNDTTTLLALVIAFISGLSLLLMIMLGYGPWYTKLAGIVYLVASTKVFIDYSNKLK